jgi:hypothetical protein
VYLVGLAPALAYVCFENYNGRALPKSLATVGFVVVALIALYNGYSIFASMMAPSVAEHAASQVQQAAPSNTYDVDRMVGAVKAPPQPAPKPTGFLGQAPLPVGSIYENSVKDP